MTTRAAWARAAAPLLVLLLAWPFGQYAVELGLRGMIERLWIESRLFGRVTPVSNGAMALHMVTGGIITILAPLQLVPGLRVRWPSWHRWAGQVTVVAACAAALGGLLYIVLQGTIGGPLMNTGFALYGLLMGFAAVQTVRFAHARDIRRHRNWALRLFVLAVASFLYRLHYALWEIATGGAASNDAFTGAFDRVQVFAFYLPYLALVEIWIRARPEPRL